MNEILLQKIERIEQILLNQQPNNWLTLKQICKHSNLSDSSIRRAVSKGRLKCSHQTGKLLFKQSWIDNYLEGVK